MPTEIERKFLVKGTDWRQTDPIRLSQGYLCREKERTVRVRLAGEKAFLTIKGITIGASRSEFEYEIPAADGEQLLKLCDGPIIEKMRHIVIYKGCKWEVDEFMGENLGLIIAEIELKKEDQSFEKPDWLGQEVTEDPRYFNSNLASNPYGTWKEREGIELKLEKLLEYVKADGRICPNPPEWEALWDMLPDKKRIGSGWEPPLPLILAAWANTPGISKMMRLTEHIRYASDHGVLNDVDTYLRGLNSEQWFYG